MPRFASMEARAFAPRHQVEGVARIGLLATPTFALMAGISALNPSGPLLCSAVSPILPINDMVVMYLLMSLFHLPPWLPLLSGRLEVWRDKINRTSGD